MRPSSEARSLPAWPAPTSPGTGAHAAGGPALQAQSKRSSGFRLRLPCVLGSDYMLRSSPCKGLQLLFHALKPPGGITTTACTLRDWQLLVTSRRGRCWRMHSYCMLPQCGLAPWHWNHVQHRRPPCGFDIALGDVIQLHRITHVRGVVSLWCQQG